MQIESSNPAGEGMNVLVVDDDTTARRVIASQLNRARHHVIEARDGASAIAVFQSDEPDLVLLDIHMPEVDGIEVARQMRRLQGTDDWVPIIFLSAETSSAAVVEAIEAGGDDYLVKPVAEPVLMAKIRAMRRIVKMRKDLLLVKRELEQVNSELQRQALADSLTGIANRRYFDLYLTREWNRQLRFGRPLALILVDVDYFKAYNDHYGHQQGDTCLRNLADLLRRQLQRTSDLVARYGGEEFAIVLPEFTRESAARYAENLRAKVADSNIPHAASPQTNHLTISLGVASVIPGTQSPAQLIQLADAALYRAKAAGRNQAIS